MDCLQVKAGGCKTAFSAPTFLLAFIQDVLSVLDVGWFQLGEVPVQPAAWRRSNACVLEYIVQSFVCYRG